MRARDAVGRRIIEVRQRRYWNANNDSWVVQLEQLVLDDGTILYPTVHETEGDYAVELCILRSDKEA